MVYLTVFALLFSGELVITEVMANPRGGTGAHSPDDRNEFVEIYNSGPEAVDLYNYTLTDGDAVDRIVAWQDSTILILNPQVVIGTTWLVPGRYAVILDPEYTDTLATGGWVQPYRFGDSTLILTVGNTTIGNGLSGNDPITLASPYGDTATFGTPHDPEDGFPVDPGDGRSWERIAISRPDIPVNWAVCPDSAGCTPGRVNAASTYFDLGITGVFISDRTPLQPNKEFGFTVGVKNYGMVETPEWHLSVWFAAGESIATTGVEPLAPGQETLFSFRARCPEVSTELWVKAFCPNDPDTVNNRFRYLLTPAGSGGLMRLLGSRFSPNADGFEDSLGVFFSLPEPGGRLTLKVFDLSGRCVRVILSGRKVEQAQGFVFWNGLNDSGEPVAGGIYSIYLEYRYSGRRVSSKLPFLVER